MVAQNDNEKIAGRTVFGPSRAALFLPAVIITLGYAALLAWLALSGQRDGAMFRFGLVVLALGVPFLLAHAWLRAITTRLQLLPHALFMHRGFPSLGAVELPYADIKSVRLIRGLGGRITGSGTLILDLAEGARLTLCDLAEPDAAHDAVAVRLATFPAKRSAARDATRAVATVG